MEATGVYQNLHITLIKKGRPEYCTTNKISNYIRTLDVKTSTDKMCSEAIDRFGL
ncbi:hypothetical protein [Flavobacterium sp. FlaQc-47]|uniref:hypothetical protein n=1 Tax=Flavobacterium sp. FlaQc-47 TaxID=3374180 RepID=UPI0037582FC4